MESRSLTATTATNVARVRDRIDAAARRAGRDPESICLVAVAKKFPEAHVRAAVDAGLVHIGENRVQEAMDKIAGTVDLPITWHLIGHLQSNKAAHAVNSFAWIHSVDSIGLLQRLDRLSADAGTRPKLLVQVDLAKEATKHGASEDDTRRIVEAAAGCHSVRMRGLMVLPPRADTPEGSRPFFRRLRELRDQLVDQGADPEMLHELSMGMSDDFEVAVEEGATMVRVGTGLFGPRPRPEA
jgi:pyridoxal phosphate enzyme (YggS family)